MYFEPLDEHKGAVYVARGSAADIWKIEESVTPSQDHRWTVIHKVLRVDLLSRKLAVGGADLHKRLWEEFLRDYRAKIGQWEPLRHENIVQVIGKGNGLNLKVEFCERGSYLKGPVPVTSESYPNKLDIISHTLNGLHYLHTRNPPVVHGNLNPGKLFIDAMGTTKIGEFGLAALCNPIAAFVPSVSLAGLSRWLSPEMLDIDSDALVAPTKESDIWAVGCVIFEIIAESLPYSNHKTDLRVQRAILTGEKPGQRSKHFDEALFYHMWSIMYGCWEEDPEQRPLVSTLVERVAAPEPRMDIHLKQLFPAYEAYYDAVLPTMVPTRVACTENTRVDLLDSVWVWAQDQDGAKVYWLNGLAGTGKTTIAYTFCKMLENAKQLGASFFCSRNLPECRDVNKIIPTIAYQLGQYSYPYRRRLCDVLDEDPDVARRDIYTQFEQLIRNPLVQVGEAMPSNVVVVIDALEECTDIHGVEEVLNTLLQHAEHLPIKFFVTSQPKPAIVQHIATGGHAVQSTLWLRDSQMSLVRADIKTYLAEALQSLQVTPSQLDALVETAGCLFIFAAIAVRYIAPDQGFVNHGQRLLNILKIRPSRRNKSYEVIDDLYIMILSNALDGELLKEDELAVIRQVLWTVACASEPLTISAITELLNLPHDKPVLVAIQLLQSVLHVSETTRIVSAFHVSFLEFLFNIERAQQFYCNEELQNAFLAECCFRTMNRLLRFNICELESSYILDQDVPDLQDRADRAISSGLSYACRYWGDHLAKCPVSPSLVPLLDLLMREHLLSWVEVLNIKKYAVHGDRVLDKALAWLLLEQDSTDLQDFIRDARNFLTAFASSPTSLSTCHLYVSALPFTPNTSRVRATYWPRTQGLIQVEGKRMAARAKSALATWVVGDAVKSIAQSRDGKRIVSGSDLYWGQSLNQDPDNSQPRRGGLCIWNAHSGTRLAGPWMIHGGSVRTVSFSPDNTRIASGLADNTIAIYDAHDGRSIAGPLRGHTRNIHSISFSVDGTCLASGSADHTIRMWDSHSGTQLGEPLEGGHGGVMSVAFSPDGKHLASGSSDHLIRVWDYRTRIMVWEPLEGHTQSVDSIAYSPDSLRLVSGSKDRTIRVWDVSKGVLLAGPFSGHTSAVSSVSFSLNGSLVVSGSHDKTIRVWEAGSGKLFAGPFEGHNDRVNSVLFAADDSRIFSGSDDGTIRVWEVCHGATGASESPGHASAICSVAWSPDGQRIASGSDDSTICVWDGHNGALLVGPLRGRTNIVNSVAFSPDATRIVSGFGDCTLGIWDAWTGALLVGPIEGHTSWVYSVTFSPDGSRIASGSADGTIRLWDSDTGRSAGKPFIGHANSVLSVAFSPDGTRIASGSYDATVRMWDANGGAAVWASSAHAKDVNCVAFSPDGARVVSGSRDKTVLVLDASDGAVLHGLFNGHIDWVSSVAFSPDGSHVVSGSWDRTVCVWDVQSGTVVAGPLKGHTQSVTSVAFSPNGASIVSGSADGTIRFWDIAAAIEPDATFRDLSVNDDGWLTNPDGQLLLWLPPYVRDDFLLPSPSNPIVINKNTSTSIYEGMLLLGDRWHLCFRESPPSAS